MNFRLFVEKKREYDVESLNLLSDIKENLKIKNLWRLLHWLA